MNDKDYAAAKKRVRKYLDKWKGVLGLGAHKLNLEWHRERDTDESETAIRCSNSWQYRLITFNIFLPVCGEQSDEELEHIIIHEFAHSLIAPLAQHAPEDMGDIHEFSTECVAQAIIWAHEFGRDLQKKVKIDTPTK